jgi:hypothetical protein
MNSSDIISMIGNLSHSLYQVETLISGLGYLLGILFIITALTKLQKTSKEGMGPSIAFFLGGAALVFMPTMIGALSNTAFGSGNILQYIQYNPYNIYNSMGIVIQTAGLIWFVRGCVLLVSGSEPGADHGTKGFVFLIGGVLAMNFSKTVAVVNYIVSQFLSAVEITPSL